MKDLRTRTLRGGAAKVCSQGTNLILRVGALMILARLLDPGDFGVVAMVTALTGVLNLFRDFGLSTATIQRADITESQLSTLFWINILVGVALSCIAMASAPVIATFYHEPRLRSVTMALAAGFLFNAAGVQHSALLQRQMRFITLAIIETVSTAASVAVGIVMAFRGAGYWSLVGMTITAPLLYSVCVWAATAWVPAWPRRHSDTRSIVRFGGTITLNGLVTYAAYNLEKVLLGRYWGASALGIYDRAYQLVNIPTENLNAAVGAVAVSALSRLRDDPARFKGYFLKGYSLVVATTLPITIACALFATDVIHVVLGPKWAESAPIFRLLAPTILVFGMINPMWWLLVSTGLVGRSLKIALVLAPLVIASYVIGLPYGPNGVALGYSTIMVLWVVPHLAWCVHGTVISLRDIGRAISRPLGSAAMAAVVSWAVVMACPDSLSSLDRLLIGITTLMIVYLGALLFVMRQWAFYRDLVRALGA